ncbi:hypothetical protein [Maridesulfovibrio sp.]|uniref:hypothetical protein n=1 Tax=Maridesulfovibrio sp. TaxID=2795000 RepID=UPI003BAD5015
MNELMNCTRHLKGYKKNIVASATGLGFISDFLQPLASFSKWILIICVVICALCAPFLAFSKHRKRAISVYVYALLMCLICGPLYSVQISGYSDYGIFAYIFPKVHTLQDELGISKKLDNISADVKIIKEDVSDIKTEVTKSFRGNELLTLVKKRDKAGRIDLLGEMKRYRVTGEISSNDFMKIYSLYPVNYRKQLASFLYANIEPNLTAEQFFTGFKLSKPASHWATLMQPKVGKKFSSTELKKYMPYIPVEIRKSVLSSILAQTKITTVQEGIYFSKMFGEDSLIPLFISKNYLTLSPSELINLFVKHPRICNKNAHSLIHHTKYIDAATAKKLIQQCKVDPIMILTLIRSANNGKSSPPEDINSLKAVINSEFVWKTGFNTLFK